MAIIEGVVREVIEQSEWVAIATAGPDGPHLAATWGDYVRALGIGEDCIVIPAGGLRNTEANLARNARVELLFASRRVAGSKSQGQGCLLRGTAVIETSGPTFDAVRARFPWARGALIVSVETAASQL